MRTQRRTALIVLILGCAVSGLVIHLLQQATQAQPPQQTIESRVDNKIWERGAIEAARSIEIRCEVKGGSTILSIVPEGSHVKKGDLLVELDDAVLREQLVAAEIHNQQAKAELAQSRAELQAVKREGEAMLCLAEKTLQTAELTRQKVLAEGGELACELTAINSELAIARARLETAQNLLSGTPEDRGPRSVEELRLMIVEAREKIKVAETRKRFLEQYERKHKSAMLDLKVAECQMQVTHHKSEFEKSVRVAEVNFLAKEAALTRCRQELDQIKNQIQHCKINAPQAGIVIYANSNTSRTSRTATIEEGAQVRERQPIVQIPDLSNLRLKVGVNESRIARVRVGQTAKIQVDALPNTTFSGKVTHINDFPEPSSWVNADVKEYTVLVSIEDPIDLLRIGLTAMVEIDAAKPDAGNR